ncbi:MAG TPA: hypothetical protein VMV66_03130 [Candidatus Humimicrobiaceae bacterium]|nr:hypothetical protein [Candidatus Humimicrobiaceae bacterium]
MGTIINFLNEGNIRLRDSLREKIISFGLVLKSCFNFGTIKKEENPKEYFAAAVLNKIYSINISLENLLLTNDIFLSNYLYRYIYELYIKVFYIFSDPAEEEILSRLEKFFENKDLKMKEYQDGIDDNLLPLKLKEKHIKKYQQMCRIAHPNIDSLNIHINKTPDGQFDFLVPTVNLIIWHSAEIIKLFSKLKLLGIDRNIDRDKLTQLVITKM